jgi:hypothetical protein
VAALQELKIKPSKGFKSSKWRSHFGLGYKVKIDV